MMERQLVNGDGAILTRIRQIVVLLLPEHLAVMQGLAQGQTYAQIACRLHISPRTAQRRCSSVLTALGARTTAEAVAVLVDVGLVKV